jgi:hypothetical protein
MKVICRDVGMAVVEQPIVLSRSAPAVLEGISEVVPEAVGSISDRR